MNDNRYEIWIFGIIQVIGTILTIVLVWRICTLEPLDVYCYFYISNTENFFEEFQKLQFSRIIAAISLLIILSSGNMAALCVSKFKFYKNLWLLSKIAMRVLAAIIGIIVSAGLLFILY